MSQSSAVSTRSFLTVGMGVAMAGAVALTPVIVSQPAMAALPPIHMVAPQLQLASLATDIKAFYDTVEPWAAYAVEVADYVLGFIPFVDWVSPVIDLVYFAVEPLVQAGVYSFADLLEGNFAQIPIDIQAGIAEAATNLVNYALAWIGSFVPLPPLPFAAVRTPAAKTRTVGRAAAAASRVAAAAAVEAPAEAAEAAVGVTAQSVAVATTRSRRDARPAATRTHRAAAPAAAAAAGPTAQKSRRSR